MRDASNRSLTVAARWRVTAQMSTELVWLNGEITALSDAKIAVEDRGFLFADGVYEVVRLYGGKPFALGLHLDRLQKSCDGLMLKMPMQREPLVREIRSLIDRSGVRDGMLYLQLTRGVASRNHVFPIDVPPTLLFFARALPAIVPPDRQAGIKLHTVRDVRWRMCWIKSIGLAANVLAKNEALSHGADEAAFVDEHDVVSECTSSNLFLVSHGKLITHPVGPRVLPGITRHVVIECARALSIDVIERPIALAEAKAADEIFITGTTRQLAWVGGWDGATVASGRLGPVTMKLHDAFESRVARELGASS